MQIFKIIFYHNNKNYYQQHRLNYNLNDHNNNNNHILFIFSIILVLFQIFINPVTSKSDKNYICPKETIYRNGKTIIWPRIELDSNDENTITIISTLSSPPCLNDNNEFVIRDCTKYGWKPKILSNCTLSINKNLYCPQDLKEIHIKKNKYICVKISENEHSWQSNDCYGSDVTIFDLNHNERNAILKYLKYNNITKFWLPTNRSDGNEYNPFVWRLIGNKWGEEVSKKLYKFDTYKGNCAVAKFYNSTRLQSQLSINTDDDDDDVSNYSNNEKNNNNNYNVKFIINDCNEKLRSVCIFEKNLFIESNCPDDWAALSYKPWLCYGFNLINKKINNNYHYNTAFNNYYNSSYYENDFDEEIIPYTRLNYLDIIRDDNIYQRFMEFYDKDMRKEHKIDKNFKPLCLVNKPNISDYEQSSYNNNYENFIFINDKNLQISFKNISYNCYLNLHYHHQYKPIEMYLNLNKKNNKLILTVFNYKSIWRQINDNDEDNYGIKCFTNADYENIRTIKMKKLKKLQKSTNTDDRQLFELKLYGDGPGYYWCETFSNYNFEMIKSKKIIASKKHKGYPFAFYCNIPCYLENCYNIHDNMKHYGKRIEKILNELKQKKNVREKYKSLIIYNVRIMNIEGFIKNGEYLKGLCHVTISLKSKSEQHDKSSEQISKHYDKSSPDYSDDDNFSNVHDNNFELFRNNNIMKYDILQRYKLKILLTNLLKTSNNEQNSWVNSTEYCFPESFKQNFKINYWRPAKIDETSTAFDMCLTSNGLPIIRKCIGDFIYGAIWENIEKYPKCIKNPSKEIITKKLYEIEKSNIIEKQPKIVLKNLNEIIQNANKLIPADFYYLSKIMNTVANAVISTIDQFIDGQFSDSSDTISPSYSNLNQNVTNNIGSSSSPSILLQIIKSSSSDIVNIYNNLMNVKVNIIKPSTKLNSTNVLLEAFETIIDEIATSVSGDISTDTDNVNNDGDQIISDQSINFTIPLNTDEMNTTDGVSYYFSPKLLVFVIDPSVSNISGIALYTNQSTYDTDFDVNEEPNFSNCHHKFLYSNQSTDNLQFDNDLEVAAFAPQSLLDQLILEVTDDWFDDNDTTTESPILQTTPAAPPLKIVIKIYFNDHLFQEDRDITDKKVYSKIISISIPGYDRELPEMFPILIRAHSSSHIKMNKSDTDDIDYIGNNNNNNNMNSCRYWNYSTWANDGLTFQKIIGNDLIWCEFSHLTPFAYLVGGTYNLSVSADIVIITGIHQEALDIITLLGCSLSLVGIFGIFITAIIFRSWREKPSSKVLLQLSFAISLQMILFCFVNTEVLTSHLIENEIYSSCIALGALLHYSVLVQFSWMLIIAYLQYKRYVQVIGNSRPTRFFVKTFIFGWGLPLLPVIIVLAINRDAYIPFEDVDNSKICYPTRQALYLAVVLPISLIIIANLIVFIIIIYNIMRNADGKIRKNETKLAVRQIRLSILLFFLLGFTWIFGLLSTMKGGILFSYLFCLTATLQGFVLFIYFIILDPLTRKMWSNLLQNYCCNEKDLK